MNQTELPNLASKRLPVLAWIRLSRVYNRIGRATTETMRAWNLSGAQFDVIAQLGQAEGITQQELAERLLVTKGNICQLLDRLEQASLIERRRDGRANHLHLTYEGRALYETIVPAEEALLASQFAGLESCEQRQLLALLRKLDQSLE